MTDTDLTDMVEQGETETVRETLTATGHENVTAEHGSTFEVTSDDYLTPAGDCIVGIEAETVPADFSEAFVTACQHDAARITITLEAGGHTDTVEALGNSDLTLDSERSAVVRTSDYIDDRTIAIAASKAADDLDRDIVAALADGATLTVKLAVESPVAE